MPEQLDDGLDEQIAPRLQQLVDTYRSRCLWFLAADYYPCTMEQALRTLSYIDRYGDRAGFVRARELRTWLLQNSKPASVA